MTYQRDKYKIQVEFYVKGKADISLFIRQIEIGSLVMICSFT